MYVCSLYHQQKEKDEFVYLLSRSYFIVEAHRHIVERMLAKVFDAWFVCCQPRARFTCISCTESVCVHE